MLKNFDIAELTKLLQDKFPQIEIAYIFGSSKDGYIKINSDIDLAFLLNDNSDKMLQFEIGVAIEDTFKAKVDIVILNSTNPILTHEVIKTGNRIFEKDSEMRAIFEANAFRDYVDYGYFLRRRYA